MVAKRQATPSNLMAPGRRWFGAVTAEYTLDVHELELLTQAAHCVDRMDVLQRQVDKDGPMARRTLQGPVAPHPLLAELRAQQASFVRIVQVLQLPCGVVEGNAFRGERYAKFNELDKVRLRRRVGGV